MRSEDSGWNITHLPTLPPLDRRHIRHHKSRAVRRPIDGLPKWPTPCLSLRNRRFHPTCQFLQIHATRPGKTRRNLSRKLQRKKNVWWVSRLTYRVWVITGLLQTEKKKKSIRIKETVKSGKMWTGRFNYGKYYICRVETRREREKKKLQLWFHLFGQRFLLIGSSCSGSQELNGPQIPTV